MNEHLRYAHASPDVQARVLIDIVRSQSALMDILYGVNELGLPDPLLAAGAIYNTVWNVLTKRPPLTAIKDADVAYFDASDISYDAEDAVIRRAAQRFARLPFPVEIRNQARVHIWFPEKFGVPYPKLGGSADMMRYFASKTHAVAVRMDPTGELSIEAPFGLDDLFGFRITPNPALENRQTHEKKAERAKQVWNELTIVPWPGN